MAFYLRYLAKSGAKNKKESDINLLLKMVIKKKGSKHEKQSRRAYVQWKKRNNIFIHNEYRT